MILEERKKEYIEERNHAHDNANIQEQPQRSIDNERSMILEEKKGRY